MTNTNGQFCEVEIKLMERSFNFLLIVMTKRERRYVFKSNISIRYNYPANNFKAVLLVYKSLHSLPPTGILRILKFEKIQFNEFLFQILHNEFYSII